MIRILQSWDEIGEAVSELERQGLPRHETPQKNWDHQLVAGMLRTAGPGARVVDLGCGQGYTLELARNLGVLSLYGIDLHISWAARWTQGRAMAWGRTLRPPYHLKRGSITATGYPDQYFDCALSVSTIEHGVDPAAFFVEARRILRPGGRLLVTTDYWCAPEKADLTLLYGVPWRPLLPGDVERLLAEAQRAGFKVGGEMPACGQPTVHFRGYAYTFLAIELTC